MYEYIKQNHQIHKRTSNTEIVSKSWRHHIRPWRFSDQRFLSSAPSFNSLRPRQNGRHFADDTFKRIFSNENVRISIKISLKFVPKGPINNNPALVQIMAWRRSGDKPLSEPVVVNLLTHICVTRPQLNSTFIASRTTDICFIYCLTWNHCNGVVHLSVILTWPDFVLNWTLHLCKPILLWRHIEVIVSQCTRSLTFGSRFCSGWQERKHQWSALLAHYEENPPVTSVVSHHKGPVMRSTLCTIISSRELQHLNFQRKTFIEENSVWGGVRLRFFSSGSN